MPLILQQSHLLIPCVSSLPGETGSALVDLTAILHSPPDQPNLPKVIENSLLCLHETLTLYPQFGALLCPFLAKLEDAFQALRYIQELHQPLGMRGRQQRHIQWTLMTSDLEGVPSTIRQLLGIELAAAYLTQSVFSRTLSIQLYPLLKKSIWTELPQSDHDLLMKRAQRHGDHACNTLSDMDKGLDGKTISFNARVAASLVAQQSTFRIKERQAAGALNEMTDAEAIDIAQKLRKRVEAGDSDAMQICLAFCMGLVFDIGKLVPFCTSQKSTSAVWINPIDGTTHVDTARVFPRLAQRRLDRNVETTLLLVRPLPNFLARAVRHWCATNPGLTTLDGFQDLGHDRQSRTSVLREDGNVGARQTIARFISSRGGIALRADIPRDSAAYATLSLSLIGSADHHYLEKKRYEIWAACDKIYSGIGWGSAVKDPNATGPGFGSRVTPHTERIRSLISMQLSNTTCRRPGKRYGLKSLVDHHNTFCSYVGLMLHIMVGGRDRSEVEFQAHTWSKNHAFGLHADKPVGTTKGLTPLPMPVTLAMQVQLWHIHLHALERRLVLLGFKPNHATLIRIAEILDNRPVDLLFALRADGTPLQLKKRDILGEEFGTLKGDFARHLIPRLLCEEGVPFEQTQAWLRHHVEGISASSITARVVQHVWLSNVSAALDRIAMALGLNPVHGITKGKLK